MIGFRPLRFHRPRKSRRFYTALAVAALAAAAAVTGFVHPATRSRPFAAFSSSGAFSYSAATTHPDPVVYPSGIATTGEELVIGDIDQVTVRFAFRFRSHLAHRLQGTIAMQDVFLGDSGWSNVYPLAAPLSFRGDRATVTATLSLTELTQILAHLQAGSTTAALSSQIHLQPIVRYQGEVGGRTVHGTFSPSMPFTLDAAVFAPEALGAGGASSQRSALSLELHPTQTGELVRSTTNTISFAGIPAPDDVFRYAGTALVLLGLAAVFRTQQRRRDDVWSNEKRVAFRAGRALVDVVDIGADVPAGRVTTHVASYDTLVSLAVQTDQPILHESSSRGELYAVDHAPRLYLYRRPTEAAPAEPERAPATVHSLLHALPRHRTG